MRSEHPALEYLKQASRVMLVCAVLLASCTPKSSDTEGSHAQTDTSKVADSTVQNAAAQPVVELSYEERQGAFLYSRYCAVCHGNEGKGDGFNAFNLDPRPLDLSDSAYMKALSDGQIAQTISGGGRSVNKSPLMPAYGWTLNKEEIRDLSAYVRTFASQGH